MSDPVYNKYITTIRALITSYGPSRAILALAFAFDDEAADKSNDEEKRKCFIKLSVALRKLFK